MQEEAAGPSSDEWLLIVAISSLDCGMQMHLWRETGEEPR